MQLKHRLYYGFVKLVPIKYKEHVKYLLNYSGEDITAEAWLGSTTLLSILMFILISIAPKSVFGFFQPIYFIFAIIAFFLVQIASYMMIYFKVEDRRKRVEKVLPDALQLIAANLKAGMTPFKALKLSARKEFGPLEEEIRYATAKALGTESFSKTLLRMSEHIKSDMLERSMKLFTTAMRSGGHLAKLLEELARDIAETNSLKKELTTNTKTYTLFIMFTIILGAPLLLAISIYFVDVITAMQAKTTATTAGFGMAFLAGEITITVDFLNKVSIGMLIITGLLASMLLGVITEGKIKHGLRYSLIIIIAALVVFAISKYVIGIFFGKMF